MVRCRSCGNPRLLTRRQARRAGLCSHCLYPPRDVAVQDRHRRFWFERFDDQELSLIVSELAGRIVPPTRIAERRQALAASGAIADGLSSAGEREQQVLLSDPPR